MIVVEGVSPYLELTPTCTRLTRLTEMKKKRVIELMKKISTELNVDPSSEYLCGPIEARKGSVVRVTIPRGLRQMFDPSLPSQVALTYTYRELRSPVFESYWGLTLNGHQMTSDGVHLFKQMVALTEERMQEEMDDKKRDDMPWEMLASGDLHDCDTIMTGVDDWIDMHGGSRVRFIESFGAYTVNFNVLADSVEIRVQCT